MATVRQVLNNVKALDVYLEGVNVIREEKEQVLDANRKQLKKGKTKELKTFKKYASPKYARAKNKRNPAPGLGNPDYKVTGAYWKSFKLRILSKYSWLIYSDDPKAKYLENRGGQPYGLNKEGQTEFVNNIFRAKYLKRVRAKMKL